MKSLSDKEVVAFARGACGLYMRCHIRSQRKIIIRIVIRSIIKLLEDDIGVTFDYPRYNFFARGVVEAMETMVEAGLLKVDEDYTCYTRQ